MVGSPFQTPETLAEDLKFIETFHPAMCGIGPFIPQRDTPFGGEAPGTAEQTIYLLSLLRIMQPNLAAACHDRPRHYPAGRTRTRSGGRRECRHAQPLAGIRAPQVRAL